MWRKKKLVVVDIGDGSTWVVVRGTRCTRVGMRIEMSTREQKMLQRNGTLQAECIVTVYTLECTMTVYI